ncbi:MAG: glycosyltransferase family 2 protein [Dorea sp.]|jgi:glycosyltransferase involved in cell wall biosynthesis|nr:glycosyltransferase family 2 protein [Dorea sp.]
MCSIPVSVIIPIYNGERHLEECLDSCLEQTLRSIEIICINDGSTDNTEKILNKYVERHENIVILNQKNQGSGAARNLGIKHANGEFAAFMDSDDFYPDKDALKKLYNAAIENKVFVCGGSALFLNDGKVNQSDTRMCFHENKIMKYREYQSTGGFTQFIYNTCFLKDNKIIFPDYRRYQDPPFFVETMTKAGKLYVIRDWIYAVRNTDKFVQYNNADIMIGILSGIRDVLKTSHANQFEMLHTNMVINLMGTYISFVYKLIYNKKKNVRKYYEEALAEIDESLLEHDSRKIRKPEVMSDDEINQMIDHSLKRERQLLSKINSYGTVLIYGAGMAGRTLYHYLLQRGCRINIEFIVTAENPEYTACGKKVKSIHDYASVKKEVLIIIANKYHAEEMREYACKCQFENVVTVSYDEVMLFGADIMDKTDKNFLTIF